MISEKHHHQMDADTTGNIFRQNYEKQLDEDNGMVNWGWKLDINVYTNTLHIKITPTSLIGRLQLMLVFMKFSIQYLFFKKDYHYILQAK